MSANEISAGLVAMQCLLVGQGGDGGAIMPLGSGSGDCAKVYPEIVGPSVGVQAGGEPDWHALTRTPIKIELYGVETYFREAFANAQEVLADRMAHALHHAALLLIKPDGLSGGKVTTILEFLYSHGFAVVGVVAQELSRLQWRELWRYQLSAATVDRMAVTDLILRGEVLLLLLRHESPLAFPATVQLSIWKGPSNVSLQPPGCLRRLLGQPNRLVNFFHSTDEPADILRELAILLDEPARRVFLSKMVGGTVSQAENQLLEDIVAGSNRAPRAFDALSSMRLVEQAAEGLSGIAIDRIRADLVRMREGEHIAWHPFAQAVAAAGLKVPQWDLATLGASFIRHDEPGKSKIIGSVSADAWRGE